MTTQTMTAPTSDLVQPKEAAVKSKITSTHTISDTLRAEVKDLNFWYGGKVQALNGINLPIADKKDHRSYRPFWLW